MANEIKNKTFLDITGNSISTNSFINAFNIFQSDEKDYFLNIFRTMNLNNINNVYYSYYGTDYTEWWDVLAKKFYDNELLWWIIPLMNDIENPFEMPPAGVEIKILKPKYVYDLLIQWRKLSGK